MNEKPETTSTVPCVETIAPINLAQHEREMAERRKRLEANQEEMMRCLDPKYAAMREMEKPLYRWRVEASWTAADSDGVGLVRLNGSQVVVAQNEADAWAQFCDRLQTWPSRRSAKPTITRLDQVTVEEALSNVVERDAPLPEKTLVPIKRPATFA